MTRIQDAEDIRLGALAVDAVYQAGQLVWPSLSGIFDPGSLANLVGWYDAADAATITASAGAVSQWNDKAGTGRHLEQATAGMQPLTGTRTLGGLNTLEFGQSQAQRLASIAWLTSTNPKTMFMVVQADSTNHGDAHITGFAFDPNWSPCIFDWGGLWGIYMDVGIQSATTVDLAPHVISAVFDPAGSGMWLDGVSIGTGNLIADWSNVVSVGCDADISAPWIGLLGEYLIYDRTLPDAERVEVENHLRTKWGL